LAKFFKRDGLFLLHDLSVFCLFGFGREGLPWEFAEEEIQEDVS
jgi:hypothetical protein